MTDIPNPLIEVGDFVRLNEPYNPPSNYYTTNNIKQTILEHLQQQTNEQNEDLPQKDSVTATDIYRFTTKGTYGDILGFTHGTVVEVLSRRNDRQVKAKTKKHSGSKRTPAQHVSLQLFNPKTKIIYSRGHPTEPGKPEFVDFNARNLTLIHKADEQWGNEHEIHVESQYKDWNIIQSP